MKKSLIALAVLAASSASFAQVSITGYMAYGFQSTTTGGSSVTGTGSAEEAGFGAETARVFFTAKEDLGGGYAATASLSINTGPQSAATGEDHSLTLATPVGGLTLGTAKGQDYLSSYINAVAAVGSYYDGWDTKLFTARTKRDYAAFTVPVGAFTFALAQHESADSVVFGTGTAGSSSVTNGTPAGGSSAGVTTLSATYAAGPLVANGQYAIYKSSQAANNAKDTTRLSANYDLGMVKLGGGLVVTNHDNGGVASQGPKTTDYLIGAKIPMGASSFGLSFASRTQADILAASSSYTGTGYSLEYGYAMSKRTSVVANYARWTSPVGVATNKDASSRYQLLLAHAF